MWKKSNPTIIPMITYAGDLPTRLYRYRSISPGNIDRLIDFEILDECIFLAGLKDLNDPDEGRFLMSFSGTPQEIIDYWSLAIRKTSPGLLDTEIKMQAESNARQIIANDFAVSDHVVSYTRSVLETIVRVACFTTHPVNYSMWANYAKYYHPADGPIDHAGVCIEYRCDASWRPGNLHPVEYSDDLPVVKLINRQEFDLVKTLYKKTREWRGEDEWRIMSIIDAKPPYPANLTANSKVKLENSVAAVIFGKNTPGTIIDQIKTRVSMKKPSVIFKRVVRNPLTYNRELAVLTSGARDA